MLQKNVLSIFWPINPINVTDYFLAIIIPPLHLLALSDMPLEEAPLRDLQPLENPVNADVGGAGALPPLESVPSEPLRPAKSDHSKERGERGWVSLSPSVIPVTVRVSDSQ